MIFKNMEEYLMCFTVIVGLLGVIVIWVYLYEAARGMITKTQIPQRYPNSQVGVKMKNETFETYKVYVNITYWFSLVMLSFFWMTTQDIEEKIIGCLSCLTGAWIFTALLSVVLPLFVKDQIKKADVRQAFVPSIVKVIFAIGILWLIY